jgi:hypothetical protein
MKRLILSLTIVTSLLALLGSSASCAERYGSKLCHDDGYRCYTTKGRDSWNKLFPDPDQRTIVMKINRMGTHLYGGIVLAIPVNISGNYMDYSPFPQQAAATGNKRIVVSLSKLAFGAYDDNGELQSWGPVSTARGYCPDMHHGCHTPTGHFAIYDKGGPGCVSKKFPIGRGGAPMPYCMYFHGGFALHGSYEVPGYNASHGCVRMLVDDAKWLNREFTSDESGVSVIVEP